MDEHEQKTDARQLSLHEMEQQRRAQFRSLPGSRSDGGMAARGERFLDKAQLLATEDAVRRIVENETHLRSQLEDAKRNLDVLERSCAQLKAALTTEQDVRAHLEATIRQIAEIVVNGSKAAGT